MGDNMRYFMGIDGGGSRLRVVIVDETLNVVAQSQGGTANPNVIGHNEAAQLIQNTIREALVSINPADLAGVGIGIAGASAVHSADWLYQVVQPVTPGARVIPSSDIEIALVGAHGEREGILLLAGTGSVACGMNGDNTVQVGGWGYLLGDEGSGYWIGLQALKVVTHAADGYITPTAFTGDVLDALSLEKPSDLIRWLYRIPRNREIAVLAPLVMQHTSTDITAGQIITTAAHHLSQMAQLVIQRLKMDLPQIAFAGGLLEMDNPLTQHLCRLLDLPSLPVSRYPPAVGAALLAKLREEEKC
jgi:glucosamine kinase